jgi:hypothetical protein
MKLGCMGMELDIHLEIIELVLDIAALISVFRMDVLSLVVAGNRGWLYRPLRTTRPFGWHPTVPPEGPGRPLVRFYEPIRQGVV